MKPDIFEHALELRRDALRTVFFDLTSANRQALAQMTLPLDLHRHRAEFLALWHRFDADTDELGQSLPMKVSDFCAAIDEAPPYGRQGYCGITKKFQLGRTVYFAKITDETLSGQPVAGQDDYDAVACYAALQALWGTNICPKVAYYLRTVEGAHCTITTGAPGRSYNSVATAIKHGGPDLLLQLQRVVLAEWLLGMQDRHHLNMLISRNQIAMIDAIPCWHFGPNFLGWSNLDDETYCHSFARAIWQHLDPDLQFDPGIQRDALLAEADVMHALHRYEVTPAVMRGVATQFSILRQQPQPIRVRDLEQNAKVWYTRHS